MSTATGAIITTGPGGATLLQPAPVAISLQAAAAAETILAGPRAGTTVIKGSVAGPVTITGGFSSVSALGITPTLIGADQFVSRFSYDFYQSAIDYVCQILV